MSEKPLVVFDMDGVLVYPRSSWRVVHDHFGVDNEKSFDLYMRGEIDDMEFMRRDISLWRREKPDLDRSDLEDIFRKVRRMRNLQRALNLVRDTGAATAIISGGIDIMAKQIASVSPVDHLVANGFESDENGILTGEGRLMVPLRNKGSALTSLKEQRGYSPLVTIGDSIVDGTMFDLSDLSVGFRPLESEVRSMVDVVVENDDLLEGTSIVRDWLEDRIKE